MGPSLGPVEFPVTSDYHWEKFDVNVTDDGKLNGFDTVQGPFQFGLANKLTKEKLQASLFS